MDKLNNENLIYQWNRLNYRGENTRNLFNRQTEKFELDDETLRDGLQSASVKIPTIEEKLKIIHYINDLGINMADIGFPVASESQKNDVIRIAKEIADNRLNVKAACAGRTVIKDIEPMVEVSQKAGIPIEAHIFIGSSMIRQYTEDWNFDDMLKTTEESVKFCRDNNLPVMYVTEDTTRCEPRILKKLLTTAIEAGAQRLCICDTVGYSTPDGVINIIDYVKDIVWTSGEDVKVDWHGHDDRGLSLCNALVAIIDAGVDRIHGTCLGIGERAGNTPIDQVLINLFLMNIYTNSLKNLGDYCNYVSKVCDVPVAYNYPAIGKDAFRTASGVHSAAILKAQKKDEDNWLTDLVYSSIPAHEIGLKQIIDIGPMSGNANVIFWLEDNGFEPKDKLVNKILNYAKKSNHILTDDEINNIISDNQ